MEAGRFLQQTDNLMTEGWGIKWPVQEAYFSLCWFPGCVAAVEAPRDSGLPRPALARSLARWQAGAGGGLVVQGAYIRLCRRPRCCYAPAVDSAGRSAHA